MSALNAGHESLQQWATFYVSRRRWKLIPINVIVNGRCSCNKFPCGDVKDPAAPWGSNAGKHPRQAQWSNPALAIQTPEDVKRWWGDSQSMPWSIGLLCGQPSGVVVLDVDPRNGGLDSLDELENIIQLPYTLKAVSGGGGYHIYFKAPPGERLTKGALHADLPGLDWQSDGSQILLPPSAHASGNLYAWADGMNGSEPLADIPEELLKIARGSRGGAQGGAGTQISIDGLIAAGRVMEGSRNEKMKSATMSLVRKLNATDPATQLMVINTMKMTNQQVCSPPLGDDEIEAMCRTAFQRLELDPTGKLPDGLQEWAAQQRAAGNDPVVATPPAPGPRLIPTAPAPTVQQAAAVASTQLQPDPQTPDAGVPVAQPDDGNGGDSDDAGGGDDGNGGGPPDDEDAFDNDPTGRSLTDLGNSRRLVDIYGNDIKYTVGLGWMYWDGSQWRPDPEKQTLTELAKYVPRRIVEESLYPANSLRMNDFVTHARQSRSIGKLKATIDLATSDPRTAVALETWDADPMLIGVLNGVVDLRTGELRPADRSQHVTKRINLHYTPGLKDSRWEGFLSSVTGSDAEFIMWLRKAFGYTLTGDTREEKFFLVYGPPGAGKSTIVETIGDVLGEYRMSLDSDQIVMGKDGGGISEYEYARMIGKRMLIVAELPEATRMKEAAVKKLTGQDMIRGRHPHERPFEFASTAKLWVDTNHRPAVRDEGMWRRMRAIPFTHPPTILDPSLKPYLRDPEGGLRAALSWAVEGAVEWYRHGLGTCKAVQEATDEYKVAEDKVGAFIAETCVAAEGGSVPIKHLLMGYRAWSDERGERPMTYAPFKNRLLEMGLKLDGDGTKANVLGITIPPRPVESLADMAARAQQWG